LQIAKGKPTTKEKTMRESKKERNKSGKNHNLDNNASKVMASTTHFFHCKNSIQPDNLFSTFQQQNEQRFG